MYVYVYIGIICSPYIFIHTYILSYMLTQAAALKEEWEQKKSPSSTQPPSSTANSAAELESDVIAGSAAGDEAVVG